MDVVHVHTIGADEKPPGVDVGRVLAVADETKRVLRQRTSAILNIGAQDAAAETARAAVTVFRELDFETVRGAALAFLVGLAAEDAGHRHAEHLSPPKKKRTPGTLAGGRQKNLRAPMPAATRYAGESFPISCPEARYQEIMARQRAEKAKKGGRP